MFTPVGLLFGTLGRRSKTADAIKALQIRLAFNQSLKKVCGDLSEKVLENVKAISFKNGVLTVKSSGLVTVELQMRAGGLIRAMNEGLGKRIVQRLRFKNG